MTSSLYARKRREIVLDLGIDTNDGLGGLSNHYVTGGTHECHPDFIAHPFGDAYGMRVCVRKPVQPAPMRPSQPTGGLHRNQLNLYEHDARPTQMNNAYSLQNRAMPHIHEHVKSDLLKLPIQYDVTGMPMPRVNGYKYAHQTHDVYDRTRLHQTTPTVVLRK